MLKKRGIIPGGVIPLFSFLLVTLSALPLSAQEQELTFKQKASYSIGLQIGGNLKRDHVDLDLKTFARGVSEALKGGDTLMSRDEVAATLREFQLKQAEARTARNKSAGKTNKTEGAAFLAKNKNAKGVITTASGLQYKILRKGSGPTPKAKDEVKVHYRGTKLNGEEFDSSYHAGEPVAFALNAVIPGWTEGLQKMNVGSKYRFFIPSNLAYGTRGAGNSIGPNATLIFDVELLGIETKK